jgi:hypothetical protein
VIFVADAVAAGLSNSSSSSNHKMDSQPQSAQSAASATVPATSSSDRKTDSQPQSALPAASAAAPAIATERKGTWVVKPGAPVWTSQSDWMERAFVQLFPYACGGPADPRRTVAVSMAERFGHYARTGRPGFMGAEYSLHAYDLRARADMASTAFITAKAGVNIKTKPAATDHESESDTVRSISAALCTVPLLITVSL